MSRIVRIGAAQLGPISRQESRPTIVSRLVALLQQAGRERCDLVVFPELALTSFFPHWAIENDKELNSYFELDMPNQGVLQLFEAARNWRSVSSSDMQNSTARTIQSRGASTVLSLSIGVAASSENIGRSIFPATRRSGRTTRSRTSKSDTSMSEI